MRALDSGLLGYCLRATVPAVTNIDGPFPLDFPGPVCQAQMKSVQGPGQKSTRGWPYSWGRFPQNIGGSSRH